MRLLAAPLFIFLSALLACDGPDPATADESTFSSDAAPVMRVMSFNIRYNTEADGADAWPHRAEKVASMIRFHQADLVGVQEALIDQLRDLESHLPAYDWVGVGRADGEEGGEFSAILYRSDRFEVLAEDTFWLSETPEEPGSIGWDAAITRIVTWARLRDRATGRTLVHFNAHYDHVGEEARKESSRLLLSQMEVIAPDAPVVFTADLNARDDEAPYQILAEETTPIQDTYHRSRHPHHGPTSTWNGFERIEPGRRIDYVFASDHFDVLQHAILSDTWDEGRFPSDHLPVLAELRWRN